MVTRRRKLLAAALVLAAGAGLAWPLRLASPLPSSRRPAQLTPSRAAAERPAAAGQASAASRSTEVAPAGGSPLPGGQRTDPFAGVPTPITPAEPATAFTTVSDRPAAPREPQAPVVPAERIHIVHEGDSLDRLAKRYLGDESRALEIFDLNRDVLDNPHLLRLGAELRIPPPEADANVARGPVGSP